MTLKKFIGFARDAWIIVGIAILMLVAVEIGFSLAFYARSFWHSPYVDYRVNADTYADASWVASYYGESEQMGQMRWRPYVYWRRMPYQGGYVNVNSDGLRKTSNVTSPEGPSSSMKVFMFGGSTMWGAGVKDEFTIPSIFAKEANSRGVRCEVTNFGVEGYVSTQEVTELMLQLQRGNIPDAVIFYDGVNDTFGGFQLSVPGLPHNEFNREKEFNLLESRELRSLAVQRSVNQLYCVRFFSRVLSGLGLGHESAEFIPLKYEKPISDRAALARGVVETYLNNIRLVRALSNAYGFKCLFYWQPMIYQKLRLTEYERKAMEIENKYAGLQEFCVDTYAYMQKRAASLGNAPAVHDLSLMFKDYHEPLFLDLCHLGEKGNSLIARRMAEDFARLERESSGTVGPSSAPSLR